MGHYKSNLRDIEFNLFEVFGADRALGTGPFAQLDLDSAKDLLREVERLGGHDLPAAASDPDPPPPRLPPTPPATRRCSTPRPARSRRRRASRRASRRTSKVGGMRSRCRRT